MAWRFNAPPGWPVPSGFVPPEGWVPDPAWPPAPADWTYWLDDAVAGPTNPAANGATPADPYAAAPGSWSPAGPAVSKRGLPGWGIALIVVGIVGFLTVAGLAIAALVAFAPRLEEFAAEFDQAEAQFSASLACDSAAEVFIGATSEPDPVQAGFQARALEQGVSDATDAADLDPSYASLRSDLVDARDAARAIAALPVDASTWSSVQRETANSEQSDLARAGASISNTCSTITDPWADAFTGPSV